MPLSSVGGRCLGTLQYAVLVLRLRARRAGLRLVLASGVGAACAGLVATPLAAATEPTPPLPAWQPIGRDHPLTGRIVRAGDGALVDPGRLAAALRAADFVLLGEKHDNPDHHLLQAWAIEALAAAGRRPAVVFEMLDTEQEPMLARYLADPAPDAAGLGAAVGWDTRGWPDWSIYAPIASAALRFRLPVVAGDLARGIKRDIARGGSETLDDALRRRLDLDVALDAAQTAELSDELRASHCGHVPETALPRMRDSQRARDAHMAAAMAGAAMGLGVDGAVLIAGAGHIRRDRGVPWHLARLAPGRSITTLAFAEVDRERTAPLDYVADRAVDFVWLTPRMDEDDPCAAFAEQLKRLRRP